jgi:hypothetical protein
MAEQRFGKVIVRGTVEDINRAKKALDECEVMHVLLGKRLEDTLSRDFYIEFHDSAYFRSRGWVFTEGSLKGSVNAGRVHDGVLYVNSDVRNWTQRHIVRHEIAHVVPHGGTQKRKDLMALMWNNKGSHPATWSASSYEPRPEECAADTVAEAVSGIDSPWDDFALYDLDVHEEDHRRFMKIFFR